jgi:KaiC/GvpD/RAD55 family RecA-like ATPase
MPHQSQEFEEEERWVKRSTGISGLDFQLGGGFPIGTSIVVYGNPLTGLDRFARQFWKADGNDSSYLMIDAMPEEGMIEVKDLQPENLKTLMKGERIVIDSLSSIIQEKGIDEAAHLITKGIDGLRKNGTNVMFILYRDVHTAFEEMRVMREAEIFISLREEAHQNEIERKLTIHKIPSMDVPSRVFPYLIRNDGIELSTTDRVV